MQPIDLREPSIHPTAFVAPTAVLLGDVHIGPNAVIMHGTVGRAELARVEVGALTNIQDNCVLHADEGLPCVIGRATTVGHGAIVHGGTVGDHCLIGIGARVLNGSVVGDGAWIAAGSLLPEGREIPPWTLAMGTPAKPVRELTEDEIARQASGAQEYQRFAATYREFYGD